MAQRRTFFQYICVKYEDVYFSIFVWWHKDVHFLKYIRVKYEDVYFLVFVWWQNDVHFCNIFVLNIKMFISCLCVVAQRRTFLQYIWVKYRCLFLCLCVVAQRRTFFQYIWVKYEDVNSFVFVWWHKDIYIFNMFGWNMKMFISLSLCSGTKTYNFLYILGLNMVVYFPIILWWHKDVYF